MTEWGRCVTHHACDCWIARRNLLEDVADAARKLSDWAGLSWAALTEGLTEAEKDLFVALTAALGRLDWEGSQGQAITPYRDLEERGA